MLGNLRGIRESGTIFMIPTYAYIVVMLAIIGYGVARTLAGDVAPFEPPAAWEGVEQGGPGARAVPRSCARSARAPWR